jgi:hypothetical protein
LQADYAGKPCPFWFFGLALPYLGVVACRRSQLKIAATPGKIEPPLGVFGSVFGSSLGSFLGVLATGLALFVASCLSGLGFSLSPLSLLGSSFLFPCGV